jgi:hypothetical protein
LVDSHQPEHRLKLINPLAPFGRSGSLWTPFRRRATLQTFGKMYRIIAHFLQKTGFLAVFISSSNIFARWVIANNHYLDKRPRINPIELGIPFVILFLALKYGAFLRGEITIRKMRWRWLFSALFFVSLCLLATPSFLDRVKWGVVDQAFSWPVSWDYVLEGIGEFYPHVVIYWMPLAGLLSLTAFIASFTRISTNEELTEHVVGGNRR